MERTIGRYVREFLERLNMECRKISRFAVRSVVQGPNGQWHWLAAWDRSDTVFACYSLFPFVVPPERRAAMASCLSKANTDLTVGNFQMDPADGWVAFRASAPFKGIRPSRRMVETLAIASFATMDQYLPLLLAVAEGKAPENDAAKPRAAAGNKKTTRRQRVEQFARYLRLMRKRSHKEVEGSCFLIFSHQAASDAGLPAQPQGGRIVQFVFEKKWFALDVPNTNLLPGEAERIVAERPGFYREAERPDARVSLAQDLVEFDPVGRKYIYGHEREAAEDTAWLFFDVFGLPPDGEFRVTAASFEGDQSYEKDEPLA